MNYNHYNRALQKRIYTRDDYISEMKKQNMVPQKEAEQMVKDWEKNAYKPYDKPNDKSMGLIRSFASMHKDKKGKIKLSDRQIDAMKKAGVNFNPKFKPNKIKGGF